MLVDGDTQISSIRFVFLDRRSFSEARLRDLLALRAPGALSFVPFLSPGPFPFTPLELQRDMIRLRRFYRRSGFPDVDVDYEVRRDAEANRVDVDFLVREGDPLVRGSLTALDASGQDLWLVLPLELREAWHSFLSTVPPMEGERIGEVEQTRLANRASGWLRDRGYPTARATAELEASVSTGDRVEVRLRIEPGPRARIGTIRVEGTQRLQPGVITRELPFRSGDWFSAARLSEGEAGLLGLSIIRVALADADGPVSEDSTVAVVVRVQENPARVISGQVGYATEAGVAAETDWSHRDFLGGARTFSTTLTARTGLLGVGSNVQIGYSASVSLNQPYFFGRSRSLLVTPRVDYRDDYRDRSLQGGIEGVVVRQWGALRTWAISLTVTNRRVFDFRLTGSEGFDFRNVLVELDELDHDVRISTLGTTLTWGSVDNPLAPRDGYLVRAGAELTGPGWSTSAQYGRAEASLGRFVPLSPRTGFIFRLAGGRMVPFGKSIPSAQRSKTLTLLRLRDALFTAGGRYDVRGWGEQLLGPKFPDVRLEAAEPDTVLVAEGYVPLGGLARATASAELRLPLPGLSQRHSSHVFVDAGRVWSPDTRFELDNVVESDLRFAVGGGLEIGTPVGPVRVSVGYKLNPSGFDVRDPQAVFGALATGAPVSALPVESIRRWHLHLAIGQSY